MENLLNSSFLVPISLIQYLVQYNSFIILTCCHKANGNIGIGEDVVTEKKKIEENSVTEAT